MCPVPLKDHCRLWYFPSISEKLLGTCGASNLSVLMMRMMVNTSAMFPTVEALLQVLAINVAV